MALMARRQGLTVLLMLALAACGSDRGGGIGATAMSGMRGLVPGMRGAATAKPPTLQESLAKLGRPVLHVKAPSRGLEFLMTVRDTDGSVTTWTTRDGTTLALKDGILIETRGLGAELMSSAAPGKGQIQSVGTPYHRSYYVWGPNDTNERRSYECTTESLGAEMIEVAGRTQNALHLRETCIRTQGKLTSDYWMQGAVIRKSRQWVSPVVGYVEIGLVAN